MPIYDEGLVLNGLTYTCELTELKASGVPEPYSASQKRTLQEFAVSGITAEEVNDPSFGVTLAVKSGAPALVLVDEISIAVRYTMNSAGQGAPPNPFGNTTGKAYLGIAKNAQGRVVVVGDGGRIFYGSAAQVAAGTPLTAASLPAGFSASLTDVVFAAGTFVAVGFGGVVLQSVDNGVTWTKVDTGLRQNLYGATYSDKGRKVYATGVEESDYVLRIQ